MADRSLLDRLNALKPSAVVILERNSRPEGIVHSAASDPLPPSSPHVSREDALTSRLRLLRNAGLNPSPSESPTANTDLTPVPAVSQPLTVPLSAADKLPTVADTSAADQGGVHRHPHSTLYEDSYTLDEEALDDLLDGLGDQDFDLADDVDFHPSTFVGHGEDRKYTPKAPSNGPDSDDSDGEPMRRDVDKLLSQLRDEFALSAQQDKDSTSPGPTHTAGAGPTPGADDPLGLPAVPSNLPTTEDEPDRKSLDFENDITTRLASLRGLGSGVNLDPFGLPVAPTFQPADRAASKKVTGGGYTDADQRTWCIVCLDDATIRCVGCDDDVFCARCWREMHLGPAAGYDERGHQWVKFVR
ncbi:Abscission/NoCut checkpoint regulator [Podospora conica]|nr:Abscission/NoCut checkpoint regulator [Schizothecium conicum]